MVDVKTLIDLIGNTPIVQVKNMDTGPCNLFLKMEGMNPGSSIKDRVALNIIETAEREGKLKPGYTIIEASAGNTAMGLALIGKLKGYKAKVIILDKMNNNKILHLRAIGAEVIMTRSDVGPDHPEHYITMAKRIADETPNSFFASQFTNTSNPLAHELSTAPEIYNQLDGKVDAVVCGVGSGGTISGIGKFFHENSPHTQIIVADPKGYVKIGEGCWGAPVRKPDDAKSWTIDLGSFNSFDMLDVSEKEITIRTIKFEGQPKVAALKEGDEVSVKVVGFDRGKVKLSIKQAVA